MTLFTETVTLNYAGQPTGDLDDYNNPIMGPPTSVESPAWFEPTSSSETLTNDQSQVESDYQLFLPEGTSLSALDSVTLPRGLGDYPVTGKPGHMPGGFILDGYVQVALRQVGG